MKSDKIPYIVYADTESLIKKIDGCANNPEKSSTIEVGEYIPCGYSISTILGFDHIENKHGLYRGKDCMKKFCDSLKEHAKNIVLFENKITSRRKSMLYLWKRNSRKFDKGKNYRKARNYCHCAGNYRGVAHCICKLNLMYLMKFLFFS